MELHLQIVILTCSHMYGNVFQGEDPVLHNSQEI